VRKLLGEIRLEPVTPEIGRPYYRATTSLDILTLVEADPVPAEAETGSTALRWWRHSGGGGNAQTGEGLRVGIYFGRVGSDALRLR
jgi:hypothetical protein